MSWPSLASLKPQAWRSICECTLNGIFAAFPTLVIILRKPSAARFQSWRGTDGRQEIWWSRYLLQTTAPDGVFPPQASGEIAEEG